MIFTTYRQYFKVMLNIIVQSVSMLLPLLLGLFVSPYFFFMYCVSICFSWIPLVLDFNNIPAEIPDRHHMMKRNKYIIQNSSTNNWRIQPKIFVRLPFAWVETEHSGTMEDFVEKKVEYRHHIQHDSFRL